MTAAADPVSRDIVHVPSDRAPGLPSFSFECPPGWSLVDQPGTVVAIATEPQPGRFRTNAVVVAERVGSATTLAEIASAALQQSSETLPGYRLIAEKVVQLGTHVGLARTAALSLADSPDALFQLQILTLAEGSSRVESAPDVTYVVQLTATCESSRSKELTPEFLAVAGSVRLGGA